MMWIEFLSEIEIRVTRCMKRVYRPGNICFVHEKHGAQILQLGAGRLVEGPCL